MSSILIAHDLVKSQWQIQLHTGLKRYRPWFGTQRGPISQSYKIQNINNSSLYTHLKQIGG